MKKIISYFPGKRHCKHFGDIYFCRYIKNIYLIKLAYSAYWSWYLTLTILNCPKTTERKSSFLCDKGRDKSLSSNRSFYGGGH